MPDTPVDLRRRAKLVGRAWFVALGVYLVGLPFLLLLQVLIPLWGAIVVLGGTIATIAFDETDGVLLAVFFFGQLVVGVAIVHGTESSHQWLPGAMRLPLFLTGVFGPFIVALMAERRARRRARVAIVE